MQYAAMIGEQATRISIDEIEPGIYQIDIDGRQHRVEATRIHHHAEGSRWLLREDGAAERIWLDKTSPAHSVVGVQQRVASVRGQTLAMELMDLRRLQLRQSQKAKGDGQGERQVKAPMPGKIVEVFVTEGQTVTIGQPLLVMEAMKMENEMRADDDVKIKSVHVKEGDSVEAGALLITFQT